MSEWKTRIERPVLNVLDYKQQRTIMHIDQVAAMQSTENGTEITMNSGKTIFIAVDIVSLTKEMGLK